MTKKEELIYMRGTNRAYLNILLECLKNLGIHDEKTLDLKRIQWINERQSSIEILRDLCDQYGDNNWSDDLFLSDIIDKHLAKYLRENA